MELLSHSKKKKKKMTQGWVVNGESPRWAAGGSVPPQSHSYKFTDDKELAQFYLNNLTENSKTTIFTIYPLSDTTFYESLNAVITYLKSFISPNIRINALRDIRGQKIRWWALSLLQVF
jgi:hypothetical protein